MLSTAHQENVECLHGVAMETSYHIVTDRGENGQYHIINNDVIFSCSVYVLNGSDLSINYQLPHPLTRLLQFSPLGTYVTLWEPYAGQ